MQSSPSYHTDNGRNVLWLSALRSEVSPVLALLENVNSVAIAGQDCWRGRIGEQWLNIAVSGVGGKKCQSVLSAILDRLPNAKVLLVGVAGGLNPALALGDVVVANRAVSWPAAPRLASQAELSGAVRTATNCDRDPGRKAAENFKVISGRILSWDEVVRDEQLRAMLHQDYGADCVDMETGAAAQVCDAWGAPFLAVRGISDHADASIENGSSGTAAWAVAVWHATIVAAQALADKSFSLPDKLARLRRESIEQSRSAKVEQKPGAKTRHSTFPCCEVGIADLAKAAASREHAKVLPPAQVVGIDGWVALVMFGCIIGR